MRRGRNRPVYLIKSRLRVLRPKAERKELPVAVYSRVFMFSGSLRVGAGGATGVGAAQW